MSSRPWYKWFAANALVDMARLSLEEVGAYRILLDHLWISGPMEPSVENLRRIWGVDSRVVRRIYAVVSPYLAHSNGLVDHPKIAEQRAELTEKSKKAKDAGRKGGLANAQATRAPGATCHPKCR